MNQWWRDAVLYQIYPRSFSDANGDGIGDIKGITRRLEHIAGLGCNGIWLSPFYPSPLIDGGYDIADFRDVDPLLGTLEDFDAMLSAARSLGLKVLIDIVPNHTSWDHPWFREALSAAPGSAERDLFIFREGRGEDGELPPSNWQSSFGGPAWTRVPDGQWYLHMFSVGQPDLNWANPIVRNYFEDTLRWWGERGVDGFRIDVAYSLTKDLKPPLRDLVLIPAATRIEDLAANPDHPFLDRPDVHEVYRGWRKVLDEFDPPLATVAEVWLTSDRRVRYTRPDELDQAFNFEFLKAPWDAAAYRKVIDQSLADARTVGTTATWVIGNHDVVRPVSVLSLPVGTNLDGWLLSDGSSPEPDVELGTRRARALALLQFALPGSAYIYQGEELGLPEVADLPADALADPKWEESDHTSKGRDGCRVPLPWQRSGQSFGFGSHGSWLPMPSNWAEYSVESESTDDNSMLHLYQQALAHRKHFASDESLSWDDDLASDDVIAFWRGPHILVVVNTGETDVDLPAGEIVLASARITQVLPGATTVWLRR